MEETQQKAKERTVYEKWTMEETKLLLELMVDGATRSWRDNSGVFSRTTVEERLLPVLNSTLQCHKNYNNYLSRLRWFKNRWVSYTTLLKYSSGFGFDPNTKRFTAPDEIWEEYLSKHPKHAHLRYEEVDDYEALEIAVGNGVAIGKNSIGLGSATDARRLGVEEVTNAGIDDLDYDVDSETFVAQNNQSIRSTPPIRAHEIPEVSRQRKIQAKRSRVEYEKDSNSSGNTSQIGLVDQLTKLTTTFDGVYNLLEKRGSILEKREHERSYTTWDAIKEITDMDEDMRLDAFNLLDTKTKKDGFLKMNVQERRNWITKKMQGR